ncbi:metallophosphoesterase [Flavobacterium sp. CAU 1735]|uniref:metallophosphoesterase n=1 Tax=Flavobacterium sp. CAU 1735 TaxID=3140361 RepID=UPI0032619126
MKLFWLSIDKKRNYILFQYVLFILLFQSCATHTIQTGKNLTDTIDNQAISKSPEYQLYLVGDAGNSDESNGQQTLKSLETQLKNAGKNTTLLFLGDNIYPYGFPDSKNEAAQQLARQKLDNQIQMGKLFPGKTIFIPGNHDWYSGVKGLERQEKYVVDQLKDKKAFLPRKGCAIDDIKLSDRITMITIDSEWYLENWDQHPTINDNCNIKTRDDFFEELESLINKNQDKTIVLAIHHPLMSNGSHGGQFSLRKELFPLEKDIPLPFVGSLINLIRKTSGISPQDIQNKQYTALTKRIKTLIQGKDNIVVVSGHDHNLQYIEHNNIKQVISGSGSKREAARSIFPNDFSSGDNGYARLDFDADGSVALSFFDKNNTTLYQQTIIKPETETHPASYPDTFPAITKASIYSKKMTSKSGFYRFLWGEHYRKYYSMPIMVQTATLDTLMGGLKPVRAGGGHQSKSLRLKDENGKEFVMRALKKSASRFLQSVAFKDQFVENEFENTFAENFLLDFYTSSHPYIPFMVGNLAQPIGVSATNPKLYYIPKQAALGAFNDRFGDELYMIEERPSDSHAEHESFGEADAIVGTDDVLKNLKKDEKYKINESEYIKARLFDMLIGDWDRHSDQWRWAENKEGNTIVYRPIPRDRDQAFSKYDGALLSPLMRVPAIRHMQGFGENIRSVKWFNMEPYPMDLSFAANATENDWIAQARYIHDNLTDALIDNAFFNLPEEVNDATIEDIKKKLKIRKTHLEQYASEYYKVLHKTVLIVGTDKKDKFIIDRTNNGSVTVSNIRLKNSGEELINSKTYPDSETKEIWIYGLNDDDQFEVKGDGKSKIKIRLLGGQNHDTYTVENGKKVIVYDFKSKENTYSLDGKTRKFLTDDYEINSYDYKKPKYNAFNSLPTIGYNPDDGFKLGMIGSYTVNGFNRAPYSSMHGFKANYYFATHGFELTYNAVVTKVIGDWQFEFEARFTSPNFAINYFGYGNETENQDETLGMDYNRVRIQSYKAAPALRKIGRNGSDIQIQATFENIEVEDTQNRYINIPGVINPKVFENLQFAGLNFKYGFENYDNPSLPTMGMGFSILGSWKMNLSDTNRNFPYIESKLNFNHKIDPEGKLVLATILKGKFLLNNNFEFYQGATIGGDHDIRGFRNERFLGKQAFYQSSDLRLTLGKIRKSIIPMTFGMIGGFDYGRVWLDGQDSQKWHNSYGGGLWLNGLNVITARVTYFRSNEDGRIAFGLGFGF